MNFCDSTQSQGFKLALTQLRNSSIGGLVSIDDMFESWSPDDGHRTMTGDFSGIQVVTFC